MRLFAYGDSSRYRLSERSAPLKTQRRSLLKDQMLNSPAQILKNSAHILNNSPSIVNTSTATTAPNYDPAHILWINQALKSMIQISPIDFEQPAFFYGNLTQNERLELVQNIAGGLSVVSSPDIKTNLISWLAKASPDLSQAVSSTLKSITAWLNGFYALQDDPGKVDEDYFQQPVYWSIQLVVLIIWCIALFLAVFPFWKIVPISIEWVFIVSSIPQISDL